MQMKKINWTLLLVFSLLFTIFTGWSATPAEQKFSSISVNSTVDTAKDKKEKPGKHAERHGWMGIHKFELEIKLTNQEELEMEFEVKKKDKVRATIERITKDGRKTIKKEEAEREIKGLLQELQLTSELSTTELEHRILGALKLEKERVKKMDVEVEFADGKSLEVEWMK